MSTLDRVLAQLLEQLTKLQREVARLATLSSGPKNNFTATTAPGVGDDSADGYSVGSQWVNTSTDTGYQCMDSTGGAAVWKQTTP